MYSINERFRQVFKKSDLSQDQFAKKIKRTRGEIANIIYDKVVPRKEIIEAVCEEFNVNRVWLETGVGEPFDPGAAEIAQVLTLRLIPQLATKFQ